MGVVTNTYFYILFYYHFLLSDITKETNKVNIWMKITAATITKQNHVKKGR